MSKGRRVPQKELTPRQESAWRESIKWAEKYNKKRDAQVDWIWGLSRKEALSALPSDRPLEYHDEFLAHLLSFCISNFWERECFSLDEKKVHEFIGKMIDRLEEHGGWGVRPNIEIIINGIEMAVDSLKAMSDFTELAEQDLHRYWKEADKILKESNTGYGSGESGFIYLVKCGNFYKIGKTKDVEKRMKSIGPNQPQPLELIHSIRTDNTHRAEKFFHGSFDSERTHGEWFRLTAHQIKMICDFDEMMYGAS